MRKALHRELGLELGLCSVVVCTAGVVDWTPSMSLVVAVTVAASRSLFFCCRLAPTGILLLLPQTLQLTTSTSAHGLLPPLLSFSIVCTAVCPGTKMVLQLLHMERFRSIDSRSCAFLETVCKSEPSCRARGEGCCTRPASNGAEPLDSASLTLTEDCRVRYEAAW